MVSFQFLPIQRSDFALVSQWLSEPHVQRWWNADPALEAIESDYGGCIDGTEPARVFIAYCDGKAIGLIQSYRWGAYPAYLAEAAHIVRVPAEASSIDYLVGPAQACGKGTGAAMIAAFAATVWEGDPLTPAIIVPVHAENRCSWRALERAGFSRIAEGDLAPDNPIDGPEHVIYQLSRPA